MKIPAAPFVERGMSAKHPWDGKINDYAVVTGNGLTVDRFGEEAEARGFARRCGRPIAVVYGPGLRNRLAAVLDGEEMLLAEFDQRRAPLSEGGGS